MRKGVSSWPRPLTLGFNQEGERVRQQTAAQDARASHSTALASLTDQDQPVSIIMLQVNGTQLHVPLSEYGFERRFDERGAIEWMQENWSKSFLFSALYAALVFGGQHYMKPRPRLNLRLPLVLWSLSLALFR
ncbi:hypothetical protein INR49_022894 [Caranx melampygus]|nr:hypothetical protein INR49_022894 [Caranx melampygus]